jgi:hypothetical protein
MKGVDLATLKELLGHRTLEMTLRYSHLAPAHKLAAVPQQLFAERWTGTASSSIARRFTCDCPDARRGPSPPGSRDRREPGDEAEGARASAPRGPFVLGRS